LINSGKSLSNDTGFDVVSGLRYGSAQPQRWCLLRFENRECEYEKRQYASAAAFQFKDELAATA